MSRTPDEGSHPDDASSRSATPAGQQNPLLHPADVGPGPDLPAGEARPESLLSMNGTDTVQSGGATPPTVAPVPAAPPAAHPPAGPAAPPGPPREHPSEVPDRFELRRRLGEGTFGVVHLAFDRKLRREVALKRLRLSDAQYAADIRAEALRRFHLEARALAAVRSEHVLQIFDSIPHGEQHVLALEYLSGGTLADRLADGRAMDPRAAAALVEGVARGAAAIHAAGIVHRDLKPGNVLFGTDDRPKVADFGLAKFEGAELVPTLATLGPDGGTRSQAMIGTPAYMSPEQALGDGKRAGPPTDVWALGAILYECLTGRRPFDAPDLYRLLMQIVRGKWPRKPLRARGVPRALERVVARCLRRRPSARYRDAGQVAAALRRFLDRPAPAPRPVARAATAVALAAALAGALGWGWRAHAEARQAHAEVARLTADGERVRDARDRLAGELARATPPLLPIPPDTNARVRSAALSPDGAVVAVGRYDGSVRLVGAADGAPLGALAGGHDGAVVAVGFSGDGTRLLSASEGGVVRVWEVAAREPLGPAVTVPRLATASLIPVALNHDGTRAAVARGDGRAEVWAADRGGLARAHELDGHTGAVACVAFGPDGRLLTAGADGRATVWDTATGDRRTTFRHAEPITAAAFGPNAAVVTACADGVVRVWDADTGVERPAARRHLGATTAVALSPDGARYAAADRTGTVLVRAAGPGGPPQTFGPPDQASPVWAVGYSRDGRRLFAFYESGAVAVWSLR